MKFLYLFLIIFSCLSAQEIGVPYVDARGAVAQSAALSPDGETFYTYANNTLTHWSLNPVKVLESVRIEDKDFLNQRLVNIYTTPDPNKIVFYQYKHSLAVYDIQKNSFVAKLHSPIQYADVIGSNIIVVDQNDTIMQLDISNLQIKKQTQLPRKQLNCDECSDSPYGIFKSSNEKTFTLVTGIRFVVVDGNSLDVLKEIISYNKSFYFSLTKKILVGQEASINIDSFETVSGAMVENSSTFVKDAEWTTNSTVNNIALQNGTHRQRACIFHNTKSGKLLAELYQYKDGSWIIMTPDGYFDRSEGSLRYLKKKLSSGTTFSTPNGMIRTPPTLDRADDAMIQKYHKPIFLEQLK